MLRASLTLLLLGMSAAAFAQNGRAGATGNATTCQEIADKSVEASPPLSAEARRAHTASAVRSKYAGQATSAPPAATSRGGGDDDTPLPRSRGSKWHSFLPGMFR